MTQSKPDVVIINIMRKAFGGNEVLRDVSLAVGRGRWSR